MEIKTKKIHKMEKKMQWDVIDTLNKEIAVIRKSTKPIALQLVKCSEGSYEAKLPFKIEGEYLLDSKERKDEMVTVKYNQNEKRVLIDFDAQQESINAFLSKDEASILKAVKDQIRLNSFTVEPSFIIGPAGTGKTTVAVEAIKKDIEAGLKIGIFSNTNMAVENILEKMPQSILKHDGKIISTIRSDNLKELTPSAIKERKIYPIKDELEILKEVQQDFYTTKRDAQPLLKQNEDKKLTIDTLIANFTNDIKAKTNMLKKVDAELVSLDKRIGNLKNGWVSKFIRHTTDKIDELEVQKALLNKKSINFKNDVEAIEIKLTKQNAHKELAQKELEDAKAKVEEADKALKETQQRIKYLEKELTKLQSENIYCDAQVVGATLVGACLNKKIQECEFDKIYIDEASMANIAMLLCSTQALNDKKLPNIEYTYNDSFFEAQNKAIALALCSKLIIIGDPQQLPPIAKTYDMRQSIYDLYDVQRIFQGAAVKNTVFLDVNFRNHPHITKLASELFYGGLLKSGKTHDGSYALYVRQSNSKMVFSDRSFINYGNMKIVVEQVKRALERGRREIGIITPYNKQVELIDQNLTNLKNEYPDADITVGTIHTFQGKEKEIIIYDITFSPSNGKIPAMYQGEKNSTTEKLLNVAMTRAKDFFIVVGDVKGIIGVNKNLILKRWVEGINDIYERSRNDKYMCKKS